MNQRYSLELKMVLHWALRSRCLLHPDLHLPYYYPCQVTRCPSGLGNCQAETFLHLQRMTAWSRIDASACFSTRISEANMNSRFGDPIVQHVAALMVDLGLLRQITSPGMPPPQDGHLRA